MTTKICVVHPKACFCKKPVASPKHKNYPQLCDNCRKSWINTKLDVSFADWKALRLKAVNQAK